MPARALLAALGSVLTAQGRVDVKALARELDVTLPVLARTLGKSPQFLREYPTAPSVQPRALQLVDRVNEIAGPHRINVDPHDPPSCVRCTN
jgi:hypothetical protein